MGFWTGRKGGKSNETYPQPNALLGAVEIILGVLDNFESALAAAAGPTATVSVTAPAFSPAAGSGAPANLVTAGASVTTSAPSTVVVFQLLRDATAIGPAISVTSDATDSLAAASIQWIDVPGDEAAHTYSIRMTPAGGTVSIGAGHGSITVAQQA